MNSALLYVLVLLADALVWAVATRYAFFLTTIGKLTIDRRLLQSKDRQDRARVSDRLRSALYYLPTRLSRWYEADDRNLTGFTPARVQRTAAAGLIATQNILLIAFPLVGAGGWDATGRRCGQLACVNAVCCGLLAHPAYTISRIVRQNDRELAWTHSLFAWHGWYEAWAHMLLSLGLMTRWTGSPFHTVCLSFGAVAIACTAASLAAASAGQMTLHQYIGGLAVAFSMIHVAPSTSVATMGVAVFVCILSVFGWYRAGSKQGVAVRVGKLSTGGLDTFKLDLSPPLAGSDCYVVLDGVPTRLVWESTHALAVVAGRRTSCTKTPPFRGPYEMPRTPFMFLPVLHVITMDNGLWEALTCVQWRRSTMEMMDTTVTWFSQNRELVLWYVQWAGRDMWLPVRLVYYGVHDESVETALMRPSLLSHDYSPDKEIKDLLPRYSPHSPHVYVIGENLRSMYRGASLNPEREAPQQETAGKPAEKTCCHKRCSHSRSSIACVDATAKVEHEWTQGSSRHARF